MTSSLGSARSDYADINWAIPAPDKGTTGDIGITLTSA
jgi:hypothetical protein